MLARLLLLLAALASSPALADDLPLLGVGAGRAVSAPYYFPGSPAAIYSTRKVVSAYAGAALNVRRKSDNATQDIGFVGANFDMASAGSFCSGTSCFVTKWYDQSGAGCDASQSNTTEQPMLMLINGRAWAAFSVQVLTACVLALTGDQTVGAVLMTGDGYDTTFPVGDYDGGAGWTLMENYTAAKQGIYWSNGAGAFVSSSGANLLAHAPSRLTATRASGAVNVYINGASVASVTGQSNTTPSVGFTIGG